MYYIYYYIYYSRMLVTVLLRFLFSNRERKKQEAQAAGRGADPEDP